MIFTTPFLFIIHLVFCGFTAQALQSEKILIITSSSSKITVDGELSDWSHVNFTNDFIVHDTNSPSLQKTSAKVVMDDENIYFAFDVKDKNIVGTNQVHDATLFNTDDLIEVFIDPDGDGENYLEFGVNAYGNIYDYVLNCVTERCGGWSDNKGFTLKNIVVKTSVVGTINNSNDTDTGFIVEIKIPFNALRLTKTGHFPQLSNNSSWRVNMFRIDYGSPVVEYQSWVPHHRFGFHQPDRFGFFLFKLDSQ